MASGVQVKMKDKLDKTPGVLLEYSFILGTQSTTHLLNVAFILHRMMEYACSRTTVWYGIGICILVLYCCELRVV
jgi:hypothetical protein